MSSAPTFYVLPGSTVKRVLDDNGKQVFDAVEAAYRLHGSGNTLNPDSYFLRYPDRPTARIIALPAHLGGAVQKSGIKWISSFPENRASNLARASAVLILNDATTGYPLACIEASLISATRTAASAALAAEHISLNPFKGTLGVIGTGVIARTTVQWLLFRNWKFRNRSHSTVVRAITPAPTTPRVPSNGLGEICSAAKAAEAAVRVALISDASIQASE